jgi:Arc/MetJ-type ribon-helix-helix transcriptional regulator
MEDDDTISMVIGMANTTKFTITLDTAQFDEIKRIVAAGQAPSVSGFVKKAIDTALNDAQGWDRMLNEMLEATGGPLTDAERRWADRILGHRPAKARRRRS